MQTQLIGSLFVRRRSRQTMQRLNAARVCGADTILCRVVPLSYLEAELWEIDQNLVHVALGPAEEALLISRRRALHEQVHGKSKARGAAAANAAMGRNNATAKMALASFTLTPPKGPASLRAQSNGSFKGRPRTGTPI